VITCKSRYDYDTLIRNYFRHNLTPDASQPEPCHTSTANNPLNFEGEYLFSYSTSIARIVHTKHSNYLLISTYSHSKTTSKQTRILKENAPSSIILLNVDDINNDFCDIKEQYFTSIKEVYSWAKAARKGKHLQIALELYKQAIHSILPELHHQTRAATLRKLANLPNIPDKLDKFTRPILLSVLAERGLL